MAEVGIGRIVTLLAARDPDRPAIIWDGGVVTRAELESAANRAARAFEALGVTTDSIVGVHLPNGAAFYVAALAAWKLGATPMPLAPALPRSELQALVAVAHPALVVGATSDDGLACPTLPADFVPDTALDDSPLPERIGRHHKAVPSGGSSGHPKVIVSHQPTTRDPGAPPNGMTVDGVQLVPGPLYHNGPFLSSTNGLLSGATIVVMSRFDPARALELIEQHQVDYTMMVPTMLRRIWQLPDRERHDLGSLRRLFVTGGMFPPELKRNWAEWLGADVILEAYGGTEGYSGARITGAESLRKLGSVGRPTGPIRILDADGEPVAPGDVGEIYFRQPETPNYHYLGPVERRERDGWESLGDMGRLDDEGYLYLADRRVDLIVSGGANVYPAEVEAALLSHPDVRDCVVIGLPDPDLGARVHAIVDVGRFDGEVATVDADDLAQHLADRLIRYKIPRTFELVREPLRSDAGKVRRSGLRDERLHVESTTASRSTPMEAIRRDGT